MDGFRTLAGKPNQDVSDHGLVNRASQDLHVHEGSEEGLLLPNGLPFKPPSPSPDLEPEGREVAHFHFAKRKSSRLEVKMVLSYLVPNFKQTSGKHKQENNVLDLKTFCSHFEPITNARNMSDRLISRSKKKRPTHLTDEPDVAIQEDAYAHRF